MDSLNDPFALGIPLPEFAGLRDCLEYQQNVLGLPPMDAQAFCSELTPGEVGTQGLLPNLTQGWDWWPNREEGGVLPTADDLAGAGRTALGTLQLGLLVLIGFFAWRVLRPAG